MKAGRVQAVRIVNVPDGDAPLWVRQAWIGLTLPLSDGMDGPILCLTESVLASQGWFSRLVRSLVGTGRQDEGYVVDVCEALAVLRASRPDAAGWWSDHCRRAIVRHDRFVFNRAACESAVADAAKGAHGP